jgi:nickel superoxide dismutase
MHASPAPSSLGDSAVKRLILTSAIVVASLLPMTYLAAHCEVPCGIYDDSARMNELLEDQKTIAKAIASIGELADTHDATGHNQLARWVATKETHATNIQHIMAQYFLTQRIKPENEHYVDLLKASHEVMVASMKCKQAADPATAEALQKSLMAFHDFYFHEH